MVITGPTLVPVNYHLPGLTGSTTIISSSTYIYVQSATTVPVVMSNETTAPAPEYGGISSSVETLSASGQKATLSSGVMLSLHLSSWAAPTPPKKKSAGTKLDVKWEVLTGVFGVVFYVLCRM